MSKIKFRYNWKAGVWDKLFRVDDSVSFVSGIRKPDGTYHTYTLQRGSALCQSLLSSKTNKGL